MTYKAILIAFISVISVFNTTAEGFQFPNKNKKIHTIIISGNYVQTRLLGELVQIRTRQPVILIPANKAYKQLYVTLPQSALKVSTAKFADFINFTNPKRVIFIGDKDSTDYKLANKIPLGKTKIYKLDDKDLMHTAWQLEELLTLNNLAEDFKAKIKLLTASGVIQNKKASVAPAASEPSIILPQ